MAWDYNSDVQIQTEPPENNFNSELNLCAFMPDNRRLPERNGERTETSQDGSARTTFANGSSITRRDGRIESAVTASGESVSYTYANDSGADAGPESVSIGERTFYVDDKFGTNMIALNQRTGELSLSGQEIFFSKKGMVPVLNPWQTRITMDGTTEHTDMYGARRSETNVSGNQYIVSTTHQDVDGKITQNDRRVGNRATGAWEETSSYPSADGNIITLTESFYSPEGRAVPIPGLSRQQINALVNEARVNNTPLLDLNGRPILDANGRPAWDSPATINGEPAWFERVREQRGSYYEPSGTFSSCYSGVESGRNFYSTFVPGSFSSALTPLDVKVVGQRK